jgi:hypothetical protein
MKKDPTGEKMQRDYKREYAKRKERKRRIQGELQPDILNEFKNYLEAKNETFNSWLVKKIQKDLERK